MQPTDHFSEAANAEGISPEHARFNAAFDELEEKIVLLGATTSNLDEVEQQIKSAFRGFLHDMDYPLASKNFDALLKEKSGGKFYRNDGSVNWLHEFIPIFIFMKLARLGKENGGYDFDALGPHGGMETSIATHLRHDSVEDVITQKKLVNELKRQTDEIFVTHQNKEAHVLEGQSYQMLVNCHFMTQKMVRVKPVDEDNPNIRVYEELHDGELIKVDEQSKIYPRRDGEYAKQDVVLYTGDMVYHPDSTPVIFILKQLDSSHNLPTMLSSKFDADRRLKRCNEREDMYGSRNGFPEAAARRWPEFAPAIKTMDAHLGFFIYHHFGILQNVDRIHKNPYSMPNGFSKYLDDMFRLELPFLVDIRQMMVANTLKFAAPEKDPVMHERMEKYLERRFIPALLDYKDRFPDLRDYESRPLFPPIVLHNPDKEEFAELKPVAFQ